ncbi:MAG: Cryptic haloacid dehalogenase 1 [uncultured Cytophagales bacterium]|uniref:Cryptic haloacid dehalogenase 1 n=1 Tax=uncultured Cytophagales bacterium TaxID=158755 RepID=A0A6J4LZD2_9SPHI|nr:MAG: Cryptic haloacid dehalogenase 1 [uncultured Cytophagales bacterium]
MATFPNSPAAPVVVFDVNGTLLDLSVLDPHFARLFSHPSVREEWFHLLERLWMVTLITDAYEPFAELAEAALRMTAQKWGIALPDEEKAAILQGMKALPPFPDVAEGLAAFREAGFRLAALTNGSLATAKTLLERAELTGFFDGVFSVEQVKRYKPAREPYQLAARGMGVATAEMTMTAAHAWDIAGARAAGCKTAFLARPGKVLNPLGPVPDWQAPNLPELARKMRR